MSQNKLREQAIENLKKKKSSSMQTNNEPNILDSGMTPNPTERGMEQRKKTKKKKVDMKMSDNLRDQTLAEKMRKKKKMREKEAMQRYRAEDAGMY